jgi:hypothetical protein
MESLRRIITRFSKEELGQIGPLLEEAEPPPPPPISLLGRDLLYISMKNLYGSVEENIFLY